MGQMASMLWWPDDLCRLLADGGRYVLRYDNRDTGASTAYPPGEPAYGGDDFVRDAIAVLDGYGIERAHVAGMSAGGAVAQLLAANFPDRVLTLTAISTTDAGGPPAGLPGPSAAYLEHASAFGELDWSDAAAIADMLVAESRALTGAGREFDEAATREFVERDLARTAQPGEPPEPRAARRRRPAGGCRRHRGARPGHPRHRRSAVPVRARRRARFRGARW